MLSEENTQPTSDTVKKSTNITDSWVEILGQVTEFMTHFENMKNILNDVNELMMFRIHKYY